MAFSSVLSASEREYIIGGVKDDVRVDGRGCRNVRHFTLKTGVVSNTSGSAKIEREQTSAIIGVKAELGVPNPSTPNMGRLEFHVDCFSLGRGGEVLGQQLAEQLEEAYSSNSCFDCMSLSVIPGEQCWVLYVDALLLEVGGSVLDSLSIGVRAALQSTVIPKLTVTGEGEEMEIEVSDNPSDSTPIDASLTPVIVTLNQIGGQYVVDCNLEEELCSSCRLSLAIDKEGRILSSRTEGVGGIPYTLIEDVIKIGVGVASEVISSMDSGKQEMETVTNTFIFT